MFIGYMKVDRLRGYYMKNKLAVIAVLILCFVNFNVSAETKTKTWYGMKSSSSKLKACKRARFDAMAQAASYGSGYGYNVIQHDFYDCECEVDGGKWLCEIKMKAVLEKM